MTLLDALDDEAIFGRHFPGPTWQPWRTFVRAIEGAPIPTAELPLYREATGRSASPSASAREAWCIAGRRSGKSRIASAVAAWSAAMADTSRLAPGETGTVLVCAVDKVQAGVILAYVRALLTDTPLLAGLVKAETAEAIELANRTRVMVRSSNFRSVRGVTLLAAIVDEVAFLRDEASANPDVELVRALKPALATTNGLLLGISSPWAKRGILWTRYRRHFGQDDSDVLVWQASSRAMHPGLSEELVAEARDDDPEAAASEWDGAFRADLESFVSSDVIDACTSPGVTERRPRSDLRYVAFLDAAAGSGRDSFTCAIAHNERRADGDSLVVLDAVREVKPPFDPAAVAAELAAFLKLYGCHAARADRFAGAWVVSAFEKHGVVVEQDAEPRSQLYLAALPLLTSGRADLLDLPRLRAQLVGLERRRRAGGRDVVDHPPGGHDDVANAVAGALVDASGDVGDRGITASNLAPAPYRSDFRERLAREFPTDRDTLRGGPM